MKNKNLKIFFIISISIFLLFGYNNCQPIGEPVATLNHSSINGESVIYEVTPGEVFFHEALVPTLEMYCSSCHNSPDLVAGISAPLTIYDYKFMKNKVNSGPTSIDNYFINKATNVEEHAGGIRCSGGVSETPCKEISEWVGIELSYTQSE